jgi:hypothetical protein
MAYTPNLHNINTLPTTPFGGRLTFHVNPHGG